MNKAFLPIIIVLVVVVGAWAIYVSTMQQSAPVSNVPVANLPVTPPTPPAIPVTPPAPAVISTIMQISSPAFLANQSIPEQFTCDGKSLSIPLSFSGVPKEAKSLALIMDDPDVPKTLMPSGLFVHWVVFNMPVATTMLAENQTPPGVQGNNGSGKASYAGPCPPDREHRYFFKLYALDSMLDLPAGSTKDQLETAMQGHILSQAQMIGLYNKKGNKQ